MGTSVFAKGYYGRFWRGYEKKVYYTLRDYCDDRTSDCFVELINRWLIPATPSYAAKDALVAYAPVLLPKNLKDKFHHEVALVLYNSERNYQILRNDRENLEGRTYGPIHEDIFDMGVGGAEDSSRSLVPALYSGELQLKNSRNALAEVSYDIKGSREDLVNLNGYFLLVDRKNTEINKFLTQNNKLLQELNASSRLNAAYSLHTEDYTFLYIYGKSQAALLTYGEMANKNNLNVIWATALRKLEPIQRNPLLYERITYGQGGNLQFTPGIKPGQVDHYRLHE